MNNEMKKKQLNKDEVYEDACKFIRFNLINK